MTPDQVIYLYCIADKGLSDEVRLPGGIENQAVEVVEHGDTSAVFSTLPRSLFEGEEAESNLQDINWITPRAAAHDEIIKRVIEQTPVYPLPFGTLFSSLERVREEMDRKREPIQEVFERVRESNEWGIRILLERNRAVEHLVEEEIVERGIDLPDTPGARHMQLQRLRQLAEKRLSPELSHHLSDILEAIQSFSREMRSRKSTLSAEGSEMASLVHWSFLVDERQRGEFSAAVERIRGQWEPFGLHIMLTGPWPPYSFSVPRAVAEQK